MGEQNKDRRFIVLLNKALKGPFSVDEIDELLAKGIARRNDLACVVEESTDKKGEWKLIWQYREFERRNTQNHPINQPINGNPATFKEPAERRNTLSPEQQKEQALLQLPPNWEEIQPEDLLPHSTSVHHPPEVTIISESVEKNFRQPGDLLPKLRLAFGVLVCGLGGWYFTTNKSSTVAPVAESAPTKIGEKPTAVAVPKRLPAQNKPVVAAPPAPAPVARQRTVDPNLLDNEPADRGEVDFPEEEPEIGGPKTRKTKIKRKKARPTPAEDEEGVFQGEDEEEPARGEASVQDENGEEEPQEEDQ